MEVTTTPITTCDIAYVLQNFWERGKQEATILGMAELDQLIGKFAVAAREYGFTISLGKEPVCVCAANREGNTYFTWFAATSRFEECGLQITRALKRIVAKEQRERPGVNIELISASPHPEAARWFKALGYIEVTKPAFTQHWRYVGKKLT